MVNNKLLFVFLSFLFVMVLIYTISIPVKPVHASAEKSTSTQRAALDSIASCGKQNYQAAGVSEKTNKDEHFTKTPNAHGPVMVDLGLYIEEIPAINELENTFTVEGRMNIIWCDPRLKYKSDGKENFELFLEEEAKEKLKVIWWPDITFANEVAGRDIANEILFVYENGTVEYREKLSVTLEAKYDLSVFPFDKQALQIEMESFAWNEEYLKLHIEKEFIGFSDSFELPEWHTADIESYIEDVMEVGDHSPFSRLVMTIDVTRQFGFYLWKVLLPLMSLVLICFAVFWMSNESLADRISVSFTGVLTVVAYQFIATGNLPKVPYITLMDAYINFSFIVMMFTIFQSIVVNHYNINANKAMALSIDGKSRWLFPLVYLVGLVAITFIFMRYVE